MPTYVDTNIRADVIAGGLTETMSRMNPSRILESFMGAANRDLRIRFIGELHQKYGGNYINKLKQEDFLWIRDHLSRYYSMINPELTPWLHSLDQTALENHCYVVLEEALYVWFPTDNQYNIIDVIDSISTSNYAPHKARIRYVFKGKEFITDKPFRINRGYMMLLDRTGRDFLAVASSRVNAYLIPIKGGASTKYTHQHSQTPPTSISETENRLYASYSRILLAELYDLTLNPDSHRILTRNILEGDKLVDLNFDIDRKVIPYGGAKPVKLLKHILRASGKKMVYISDDVVNNSGVN